MHEYLICFKYKFSALIYKVLINWKLTLMIHIDTLIKSFGIIFPIAYCLLNKRKEKKHERNIK